MFAETRLVARVPALLFTPSLSRPSSLTEEQKRWQRGRWAHGRKGSAVPSAPQGQGGPAGPGGSRTTVPGITNLQESSPE